MQRLLATALCLFALASPASAAAESRKAEAASGAGRFNALLLITADPDWEAKWNTPAEVTPQFGTVDTVSEGGKLTLLVFVSNLSLDATGSTDIACDYRVTRPDGTSSLDARGADCLRASITSDPRNVYLTTHHIEFLAEPGDPRGTWRVEITVTDRVSGAVVPLQGTFELE